MRQRISKSCHTHMWPGFYTFYIICIINIYNLYDKVSRVYMISELYDDLYGGIDRKIIVKPIWKIVIKK